MGVFILNASLMNLPGNESIPPVSGPESFRSASFRFLGFLLSILRRRVGLERCKQPGRDAGNFIDRGQEHAFVGFGRFVESADLSYELERGGSNLVVSDGRIEIE